MTNEFQARPAVRERVPLLIGLTGASGGGKTLSALRLATGIARVCGKPIYYIDTENRRSCHYADDFRFQFVDFPAPWSPERYVAAIESCRRAGAGVVVVDSASHEQEHLTDAHEEVLDKMAGDNWQKREACKMVAWAKVKAPRKKMLSYIRRMDINVIFCFRAHNTVKPVKAGGKTEIVQQGFVPVGAPELVFEMTANILLMPNSGGVPTWQSEYPGESLAIKNPVQFHEMFRDRKPLDEATGEALARWAAGSAPAPPIDPDDIIRRYGLCGDRVTFAALETERKAVWPTVSKDVKGWLKTASDVTVKRLDALDATADQPASALFADPQTNLPG